MRLQSGLRDIQYAEQLPDTTVLVIGLWNMGYTDLWTVAHLLWIEDLRPLERLYLMLRTTEHRLIRHFVDYGLPPGVCRKLAVPGPATNAAVPRRVRCPLCKTMLDYVPCPRCSIRSPAREAPLRRHRVDLVPPPPIHQTSTVPGTSEKIAVMRGRYERGEQIFHPRDRRLPKPKRNGR